MRTDGDQLGAERAAPEAYERKMIKEKLTEFRRFITGSRRRSGSGAGTACADLQV
ncbi:hypothetical protein ACWGHU_10115 [Streptomyces xanthophaeus]